MNDLILWLLRGSGLETAHIAVSDGHQTATRPLDSPPVFRETDEGVEVTLEATFGPTEANFRWDFRWLALGDQVLDRVGIADGETKILGAEWVARVIYAIGIRDA